MLFKIKQVHVYVNVYSCKEPILGYFIMAVNLKFDTAVKMAYVNASPCRKSEKITEIVPHKHDIPYVF